MSSFPRTLEDLTAGNNAFLSSQSFYGSLKELRKSTLSIPNRLRSILTDADFVQEVAAEYMLPLIANERCGSWYIHPDKKAGSAYFKSTDGHAGQWSFSLRRLNLQLLDIVGHSGGCVIVDSTRRGKAMPDAFSKTVPIWCAVLNRALFPEQRQLHHLQLQGCGLPASEIAQIESRIDDFLKSFHDLGFDEAALRQRLGRPMRLQLVVGHSTEVLEGAAPSTENEDMPCHTVILCSASRRVKGSEMSEGGYIQGAGDDSEGWSQGLTSQVFWRHMDMLFQATEEELPELIQKLVSQARQFQHSYNATLIEPTSNLYISAVIRHENSPDFGLFVNCHTQAPDIEDDVRLLNLRCASGKRGSRDLRHKLHLVSSCAARALQRNPACRIVITCETGRDLSVGVALLLLCLLYSNDGKCIYDSQSNDISAMSGMTSSPGGLQQRQNVDKSFIRQRLAWISSSKPDAHPSRSTLQSINAFLMERP
jgi:tRNA A64-2'-O-ribosylphosphate transferase